MCIYSVCHYIHCFVFLKVSWREGDTAPSSSSKTATGLIYTHKSWGCATPKEECGYINKIWARSCYNIYVTFLVVVYRIALNYPVTTMLQVRYYAVSFYHISLTSQKLRKRYNSWKRKWYYYKLIIGFSAHWKAWVWFHPFG